MAEYFPEEIKTPRSIAKLVLVIILFALLIGNYIKNRNFYVSSAFYVGASRIVILNYEVFFAVFVFAFLTIFFILYYAGFHFTKSDVSYIIILVSVFAWLGVNNMLLPNLKDKPASTAHSDQLIARDSVSTVTTTDENGITVTITTELSKSESYLSSRGLPASAIVIIAFAVIIFSIIILILFARMQRSDFTINIYDVDEYSKPTGELQRNIVEIYIKTSQELETNYDKAPDWYSPTYFADKYGEKASQLISSYLHSLTKLYEKARFSPEIITENDVASAEDLAQQISATIAKAQEK